MRKSFIIGIVSVGLIVMILLMMRMKLEPMVMIEDGQNINVIHIDGETIEDEAVVGEIVELLQQFEVAQTDNPFPIATDKIDIEIDYVDNHKPRHIILGEINILYESGDKTVYKIIDGEKLHDEIEGIKLGLGY